MEIERLRGGPDDASRYNQTITTSIALRDVTDAAPDETSLTERRDIISTGTSALQVTTSTFREPRSGELVTLTPTTNESRTSVEAYHAILRRLEEFSDELSADLKALEDGRGAARCRVGTLQMESAVSPAPFLSTNSRAIAESMSSSSSASFPSNEGRRSAWFLRSRGTSHAPVLVAPIRQDLRLACLKAGGWESLLHGGEAARVSPSCRECDASLPSSCGTMEVDQMLHHLNLACGVCLASADSYQVVV